MAIDDADPAGATQSESAPSQSAGATVGEYTWEQYLREYGDSGDADAAATMRRSGDIDWDAITAEDRAVADLGVHPTEIEDQLAAAAAAAARVDDGIEPTTDLSDPPVAKDWYAAEHFESDHPETTLDDALGFDAEEVEGVLSHAGGLAEELSDVVDQRTVSVQEDFDEDAFFRTDEGHSTVVTRYDLEKTVPLAKKGHFREIERYWVNEPYSFVIIFHSTKENEKKYYVVQPYMNRIEDDLVDYLTGKLRTAIKYSDDDVIAAGTEDRGRIIEAETLNLLDRYGLFSAPDAGIGASDDGAAGFLRSGPLGALADLFGLGGDDEPEPSAATALGVGQLDGIAARPESAVLEEDAKQLNEYQVEKLLYYLRRDFIGYERIDGIKHDINVEDISCDGYNSPVFVYHSDYEQIISNVYHGKAELDDFVVKLAQRSGKGISKRSPQVDATLPDGSRAQLTLGQEVSDHGTNYTIRQFKDVPFTPIDLICWNTFSLDEMAFLWLCIENHKSLIFAGGTASGKTTSLNAVSLFIPSNSKIVSIEDTREVELPQRNWIASVTRPSFAEDDGGDVDEFALLEAALRQRPDYIVMGEIRGEEGRTLFQVMSTGHTTYTTFHADSVGEVLKRFTTEPINVSKTMFTALDLVSIQTSTRVGGNKVRRNKSLTEINHYDAENDEINVQDVYQWQAETDEFLKMGNSNTLEEIMFDRGWTAEKLDRELFKRQLVLAYLIDRELNSYAQVAATFQAFINDQETILSLIADDRLEQSLEDLREMESVHINIEPEKEAMVPRPSPDTETAALAEGILGRAEESLLPEYRGNEAADVVAALASIEPATDVTVGRDETGPTAVGADGGDAFTEALEDATGGRAIATAGLATGAASEATPGASARTRPRRPAVSASASTSRTSPTERDR
ncbi:secretion system protein E [Salinigranum rubrum]|uniref:Secretion system protein E n=1 Tax=Salinigranum rubrum TaxID=755307 RepID=A0A2I8VHU2_9EURY|nr:type II/IV secretion system ATPase subunit [Salinigranum rubrum]AUV81502.1 secretion system protein E [Salinigranum rubrum]